MPLIESSSKQALQENTKTEIEHGKEPAQAAAIAHSVQRANDFAQPCAPEFVTLQTLNEQNRKYWGGQGGEGVIT